LLPTDIRQRVSSGLSRAFVALSLASLKIDSTFPDLMAERDPSLGLPMDGIARCVSMRSCLLSRFHVPGLPVWRNSNKSAEIDILHLVPSKQSSRGKGPTGKAVSGSRRCFSAISSAFARFKQTTPLHDGAQVRFHFLLAFVCN
jgi:hypothetical protein